MIPLLPLGWWRHLRPELRKITRRFPLRAFTCIFLLHTTSTFPRFPAQLPRISTHKLSTAVTAQPNSRSQAFIAWSSRIEHTKPFTHVNSPVLHSPVRLLFACVAPSRALYSQHLQESHVETEKRSLVMKRRSHTLSLLASLLAASLADQSRLLQP